jgi:hypothetical protein
MQTQNAKIDTNSANPELFFCASTDITQYIYTLKTITCSKKRTLVTQQQASYQRVASLANMSKRSETPTIKNRFQVIKQQKERAPAFQQPSNHNRRIGANWN